MITKTAKKLQAIPSNNKFLRDLLAYALGGLTLGAGINRGIERFTINDNNINPNKRYIRSYQ